MLVFRKLLIKILATWLLTMYLKIIFFTLSLIYDGFEIMRYYRSLDLQVLLTLEYRNHPSPYEVRVQLKCGKLNYLLALEHNKNVVLHSNAKICANQMVNLDRRVQFFSYQNLKGVYFALCSLQCTGALSSQICERTQRNVILIFSNTGKINLSFFTILK